MTLQENISLLPYNTFGIDVNARYFAEYYSVEELKLLLSSEIFRNNKFLHIGGGSNLLFLNNFEGIILHSGIKGIEVTHETDDYILVKAGAAEVWDDFVAYTVNNQWGGIENLSIIPGEVGASAVQNIGAYGVEAKDVIDSVETIEIATGKERTFTNEECNFAYRNSIFKKELKNKYIVTYITFRLSKNPVYCLEYGNITQKLTDRPACLETIRSIIIEIRDEKLPDPSKIGNGGSFFMNPVIDKTTYDKLKNTYPDIPGYIVSAHEIKVPAGWLIDRCGWKGKTQGRAGVYEKQALVLINTGGATGKEIKALSDEIIRSVKIKFDIDIHPEVNFIE